MRAPLLSWQVSCEAKYHDIIAINSFRARDLLIEQ